MNRKFFLCLSRVVRFFIVLPHFDITNARHIHSTPLPSTCEKKKKLTTHPTANYSLFTTCNSLCTTQYYLLIDYCSLIKATCSLLPAHYSLLIVHYSHTYFSILTTHHPPFFSQLILTAHYSILTTYNSLLSIYYSPQTTHYSQPTTRSIFYYSPLMTHCPLYEYWSIITHDLLLTINHSLPIIATHYALPTRTTCFASRPFTSSTNKSMNMLPDESQVFPLPVECVSFLHCSSRHTSARHIHTTPL